MIEEEHMVAADPAEIEMGEDALVTRVMDDLKHESVRTLLMESPAVQSISVDGVRLSAYKGAPVVQLDLGVEIVGRVAVEVPFPHICRDAEELSRRSRRFWRALVNRHESS